MILHIDGEINKYYVQTLLMAFFPGSTFGENEEIKDGIPEAWVNVYADDDGSYTSYVRIRLNDRVCEATETVSGKEEITISTHASLAVGRAIFAAGKELIGILLVCRFLSAKIPCLHFIQQEIADILQRHGQNTLCHGRGIQHNGHSLLPCCLDQIGKIADLVLKNQNVTGIELCQCFIDLQLTHLLVCTAKEQNTVLTICVHLDNGMSAGTGKLLHQMDVHAAAAEHIQQHTAVCSTYTACMIHISTGAGNGNRLIQSFSAAEFFQLGRREGFPRPDKMLHRINLIQIQRAKT